MAQPIRRRRRYPKGTWMKLHGKEVLILWMEKKNFSVQRLATYSECSKSMIGHLRSGAKSGCTPDLAVRIAEALDVPVEALFERRASAGSSNNVAPQRKAAA